MVSLQLHPFARCQNPDASFSILLHLYAPLKIQKKDKKEMGKFEKTKFIKY